MGIVYDATAGTITYYINGAASGVDSALTGTWAGGSVDQICLGARDDGVTVNGAEHFDGVLDDVRWFDRALSSSEMLALCRQVTTATVLD